MRRAIVRVAVLAALLLGATSTFAEWVPIGPTPVRDGQIENVVPDNQISGAIHVVLAHPTDADTLYVGTVNGGIWKTTNATAARPLWYPLTSGFPGSIGALVFDSQSASNETLVAAHGQFSSYYVGGPLNGLLRSVDGGAGWTSISDPLLDGRSLTAVAARGPRLMATASPQFSGGGGGFFRSADGGSTWSRLDGDGTSGLDSAVVGYTDLIGDPALSLRLYTASRRDAVYRSGDAGASWVDISSGDATLSTAITNGSNNNVELAVGPTGRLWVSVHHSGTPAYIGYTDDPTSATPTWVAMDLPLTLEDGGGISDATDTTPIVVSTATAAVTGASNATPIVVTSNAHGLRSGVEVNIAGVAGNNAANGDWFITALDVDSFELQGSVGDGDYSGGGDWKQYHSLGDGDQLDVAGVTGNLAANGLFTATVLDGFSFELDGTVGGGAYSGGGIWSPVRPLNPSRPGGQGFIHSSIVAHPTDPDLVFVGGDTQPWPFPNGIGANDYSGRLFRGDASIAAGGTIPSPQWEHLTHLDNVPGVPGGGTASSSSPHADSREMVFDAAGDLIETSDGGIYRRTNPADNSGDWFSINGTLQVTEMHNIAYDTLSNVAFAGTQDNGNVEQPAAGAMEWANILGGDGADVAVDVTSTPGMSIRYRSAQFLGAFVRDFYDASGMLIAREFPALDITDGSVAFAQFTTPIELNRVDPTRLIIGASNHVYESFDQGDTMAAADPFDVMEPTVGTGANWDAIAYGGYQSGVPNAEVLYFGSGGDVWVRTAAAPAAPVTTCYAAGYVRDLVLAPDDWTVAYVVSSGSVVEMTGTGTTCSDISGDLSAFSELRINRIEYIEGSPARIAISGEFGGDSDVKVMDPAVPGVWTSLGPGLPDTLVYELDYDTVDDVLVAGTMGRGAWSFDVGCSPAAESPWYRDVDGDGFGDALFSVSACAMPGGFVADATDCDDSDATSGAPAPWYRDMDTDGFGDVAVSQSACDAPAGFVADGSDCDDTDVTVWNVPGEVLDLRFGTTKDLLLWSVPAAPGGQAGTALYDTIRAPGPTAFDAAAVCVEFDDGSDLEATDGFAPAAGGVEYYLIRAENLCGAGSAGEGNPGGTPRPVQACP